MAAAMRAPKKAEAGHDHESHAKHEHGGQEHKEGEEHAEEGVINVRPDLVAGQDIKIAKVDSRTLARHLLGARGQPRSPSSIRPPGGQDRRRHRARRRDEASPAAWKHPQGPSPHRDKPDCIRGLELPYRPG